MRDPHKRYTPNQNLSTNLPQARLPGFCDGEKLDYDHARGGAVRDLSGRQPGSNRAARHITTLWQPFRTGPEVHPGAQDWPAFVLSAL